MKSNPEHPMHGVLLDRESLDTGDIDFSRLRASLDSWDFHDATAPGEIIQAIENADVVVSNKVLLNADTLEQAKRLRLVCIAATGTNNVDLDAARRLGITVTNVRGYATPSVVQHVFGLILSLTTHLPEYHRDVMQGRWGQSRQFCLLEYPIREIAGRTLGIIGYGELGRAVADVARGFGMSVLIAQRPGSTQVQEGRLPLHELLPRVDVLSLHCPLTPDTRDLIGAQELALLKTDALLINTARGGIVDEQALADALRAGRLGGAGIDVLAEEPPRKGSPLLAGDVPNLIVTPHTAWASREARQRLMDEVAGNIEAFLRGQPRNSVRGR